MTAAGILATLRCRGVELRVDGDVLRYRAPRGVLTDAGRTALRQHREELIALLRLRSDGEVVSDGVTVDEVISIFPGAIPVAPGADPFRERDEALWRRRRPMADARSWFTYGPLPPDFHALVPARDWVAGTRPTIDVYGPDAPTVPCPVCGAMLWHRAESGWSCSRCHPPVRGRT